MYAIHLKLEELSESFSRIVKHFRMDNPDSVKLNDLSSLQEFADIIIEVNKTVEFANVSMEFANSIKSLNAIKKVEKIEEMEEEKVVKKNYAQIASSGYEWADADPDQPFITLDDIDKGFKEPLWKNIKKPFKHEIYLQYRSDMYFEELSDFSNIKNKNDVENLRFCHADKKIFYLKSPWSLKQELYLEQSGEIFILQNNILEKLVENNKSRQWLYGIYEKSTKTWKVDSALTS
jgi:hypothetical protein